MAERPTSIPAPDDAMPMCCVGRVYIGWMTVESPCNRRATVTRGSGHYCRKHDPERIRTAAARNHEAAKTLRFVADSVILLEAKRRGLV